MKFATRVLVAIFVATLAFSMDANAQRRQRLVARLAETPWTSLTIFSDQAGWHVGFSAWFPVPEGVTMTHGYVLNNGTEVVIPPATVVTAELANSGWAGWIWGKRSPGQHESLPEGAVAFRTRFTGTLNFSMTARIEPGAGPLESATVYPDGKIFIILKPGYYGISPVASVLGRGCPVEWGWITPPEGSDFHGPNIPVTVCVGFPQSECSTRLLNIPAPH